MSDADVAGINAIGAIFILSMCLLILTLPRRLMLFPIIASACFMTLGQQVVIADLHFTALRIIIFFGWLRLIFRRDQPSPLKLNTLDKLIIVYTCVSIVIYVLLWRTSESLINHLGFGYNVFGIYFLCRQSLRSHEDIERAIKIICICLIPLACLMLIEELTGRNIFSIFGGVPLMTVLRDGKLRAQGPFRHPILAGTLGATSMPLLIALWAKSKNRTLCLKLGLTSTAVVALTSVSSGPALAYMFGLISLMLWRFRLRMRLFRWGIAACLVALHTVMKAPVWFLLARVNVFSSSTGWHRAYLIDQTVNHFSDWWLIGTQNTGDWFPYALSSGAADITNQFIGECIDGGLLRLSLFVAIIIAGFRIVGMSMSRVDNLFNFSSYQKWCLGACLFSHVVSFLSVAYFDQIIVFWYMLLAMIATLDDGSYADQPIYR